MSQADFFALLPIVTIRVGSIAQEIRLFAAEQEDYVEEDEDGYDYF